MQNRVGQGSKDQVQSHLHRRSTGVDLVSRGMCVLASTGWVKVDDTRSSQICRDGVREVDDVCTGEVNACKHRVGQSSSDHVRSADIKWYRPCPIKVSSGQAGARAGEAGLQRRTLPAIEGQDPGSIKTHRIDILRCS